MRPPTPVGLVAEPRAGIAVTTRDRLRAARVALLGSSSAPLLAQKAGTAAAPDHAADLVPYARF